VVALSALTYQLVEQPFRSSRVRGFRGRVSLVLWPVSIGAVVLSTVWVDHYGDQQLQQRTTEAQQYYEQAAVAVSEVEASIPRLLAESVALAGDDAPIHFPLDNLEGLRNDHWAHRYPCYVTGGESVAPDCVVGDAEADTTVVAFGDSHMGMWLPALDAIGRSDGFRVVPFVKRGCVSFDVPMREGRRDSCAEFRVRAVQEMRALDPEAILLSNRALPPNFDAGGETVEVWEESVRSTLRTMAGIAPTVRVFDDVPQIGVDPADCVSDSDSTMATCTPRAGTRSVQGILATRKAADSTGVPYVNVAGLTCFKQRCPLVVGQTIIYRDDDHISMTWAERLTDELRARMALGLDGS
jgi:hypothetical protein